MRLHPTDGTLLIAPDEFFPAECDLCLLVYRVTPGSYGSKCPQCGHGNWHTDRRWIRLKDGAWRGVSSVHNCKIYDNPQEG